MWRTDNRVALGWFRAGACAVRRRSPRRRRAHPGPVVPATSRHFTTARLTSAVTLLSGPLDQRVSERQIRDAARLGGGVAGGEPRVLQIRALVLGTAMDWLADNTAHTNHILGFPFTQPGLQLGVSVAAQPGPGGTHSERTATR